MLRPTTNRAALIEFACSVFRIASLRSVDVNLTALRQLKSSMVMANCGADDFASAGTPPKPSAVAPRARDFTKVRLFMAFNRSYRSNGTNLNRRCFAILTPDASQRIARSEEHTSELQSLAY